MNVSIKEKAQIKYSDPNQFDENNHTTEFIIEVQNLEKTFNDVKAVDGISLKVRKGELFSLLGPNGAGKSTTIRMLTTVLKPSNGSARIK